MPDPNTPEVQTAAESTEATESFKDLLSEFEQSHARKDDGGRQQVDAVVIAVTAEAVVLDVGQKIEGMLPVSGFGEGEVPKVGDHFSVTVKGRDPETGYLQVSRFKERRVTDWESLQQAFNDKATISGVVTAVIKGGLSVDVGVRAFMPASRSGTRDAAEMEALAGQEIRCRITKLDVTDEDVVVDRRAVLEEEERAGRERRAAELKEGDTVSGTVRSLTDYGAFVDLGGVDGLLHVGEISWARVNKPADVLAVGQQVEVRILKIDSEKRRISLGMKQLQPHPWDAAAGKYAAGQRVRGRVTRVADFGAFVEIETGVEGLIHISELSWGRKVKRVADVVKPGETVDAVVLGVNPAERRIALGLKQALGDPWAEAEKRYAPGTVVEGPVTSLQKFGAFVQLADGIEGMIHVSEISSDKPGAQSMPAFGESARDRRINHPQDVLKAGQTVRAQVLAVDKEKRQIKLSMKQLVPTSIDEYIAEHKRGDLVTGRIVEISGTTARVELGEGIAATAKVAAREAEPQAPSAGEGGVQSGKADLSSLSSMLQARWKGASATSTAKPEPLAAGQVRSFRIAALHAEAKKIELELA